MIRFKANGKEYTKEKPVTIMQFIHELTLSEKGVIVEYNKEFLVKELYEKTVIRSGDRLEIVQAFCGG